MISAAKALAQRISSRSPFSTPRRGDPGVATKKPEAGGLSWERTSPNSSTQKLSGTVCRGSSSGRGGASPSSGRGGRSSSSGSFRGSAGDRAGSPGAGATILPLLIRSSSRVSRAFISLASRLSSGRASRTMHISASIRRPALRLKQDRVSCTVCIIRTSSPVDSLFASSAVSESGATPESMATPLAGAVLRISRSRSRLSSSSSRAPRSLPWL